MDPKSGLRVVEQAEHAVYPLADYPATAHALEQGCAFVAGVDLDGSDPAEVAMLHELGYNALLAVGTFDGKRGYLLRSTPTQTIPELDASPPTSTSLLTTASRPSPDSTEVRGGLPPPYEPLQKTLQI